MPRLAVFTAYAPALSGKRHGCVASAETVLCCSYVQVRSDVAKTVDGSYNFTSDFLLAMDAVVRALLPDTLVDNMDCLMHTKGSCL